MSTVLGINLSHDRSAAVVRDGKVVVAVEEERLDRIKHSEGFLVQGYFERLTKVIPIKAITYCLRAAGVRLDELDAVVGNRPLGDGAVHRILRDLPIADPSKVHAMPRSSHHLAHAATTFYTSGLEESAVLVVDQAGTRDRAGRIEKHTLYRGRGTALDPIAETTYPEDYTDMSLGCFYDFFTTRLGFITRYGTPDWGIFSCGGYPEAGKTMGLAPYGHRRPDWGPWLTYDGFDIHCSQEGLEEIWRQLMKEDGAGYDPKDPLRWQHPFAQAVAFKVQDELEQAMLHLAGQAKQLSGSTSLCLAGGITLNSVANQKIRASGLFDTIHIPAPTGDSGNALGAALWGYHVLLEGTQPPTALPTAALGRTYDDNETSQALDFYVNQINTRETTVAEVASLIADGHVVAWVNTGSEMGPRALGHRSILADPRRADMRDYLNTVVKHREVFRPYAPSALAEHAHEWFDFEGSSPFMLFVPEVLAHCRDLVPSITHVDGTARLQTVDAGTDPEYHALITAFHDLTGVPMVLNTSFNDNGEPIVEGPCDAVRTFLNTKIDYLVLGGHTLVTKRAHTLPDGHPSTTNAMQVV